MEATTRFRALDAVIEVRAPRGAVRRFSDLVPGLVSDTAVTAPGSAAAATVTVTFEPAGRRTWKVLQDGTTLVQGIGWWEAVGEALVVVNAAAARSRAASDAVLHAGSVEIGGRVVALAGLSGAGKSTLTATCVRRGHGFVGEEVCAIDPAELLVRPYHRPIGLRRHDERTKPFVVTPSKHRLAGPGPLGLVAMLDRAPGPASHEVLRPAQALVRLVDTTTGATGHEEEMFWRLDRVVRHVPVIVLRYEEAPDGAAHLEQLVRSGDLW